jgi:hypothetical protein
MPLREVSSEAPLPLPITFETQSANVTKLRAHLTWWSMYQLDVLVSVQLATTLDSCLAEIAT